MDSIKANRPVVVSPVALVLTEWQGKRCAKTTSFFSEVAHHPTTLWVSIEHSSEAHELIQASGRFTLVVLDQNQAQIARACDPVSQWMADNFAGLKVYCGPEDALHVEDAFASAVCRVRSARKIDGYTIFIADILAGEFESRRSIHRHLLTTDLE